MRPTERYDLKQKLLAKLLRREIDVFYVAGSMRFLRTGVDGVPCQGCDEPIFSKETAAVECRFGGIRRHSFHLYCDTLRLIVASEHLLRLLEETRKALRDGWDGPSERE